MKRLTLHHFIASSLSTLYKSMQKSSKTGKKCPTQMWRQRRRCFFTLLRKIRRKKNFFWNCQWDSLLHRFCALILFVVKVLRQWWRIREAIKWWNVNYGKKLKQWSDEAFNAGKEIEAMKHLTLHRIASSLHHFCCPALQIMRNHRTLGLMKVL